MGTVLPLIMTAFVVFSCASREPLWEDAPIITSATYQHTQYNGRSQAVEAAAAKGDAPPFIVTYFRSPAELEQDRNGSADAPVEVGDYYARIERPGGKGYRRGNTITIEYHIQKAFITITADPVQRFAWDGSPKAVAVAAEPPVDLAVSYYDAADPAAEPLPAPPSAPGRYRAAVVFPGNDRYMGASRDIELRITR
jgi:hypothetical protein